MSKRGRPRRLGPSDIEVLKALVMDRPLATLGELTTALVERTGQPVHPATVRKAAREAGILRVRGTVVPAAACAPRRYGYTARHRAQAPRAGRCLLLRGAHRLRLASVARRVPALGQRLQDLPALERAG